MLQRTLARLLLVSCALVTACNKPAADLSDATISAKPAPPPSDVEIEVEIDDGNQKGTASLSASSTAVSIQAIPGLTDEAADPNVMVEVARVDPRADGWDTEAFNEHALAQLKRLKKWLEHQKERPVALPNVFANLMQATSLRPASLDIVFDDSSIQVKRGAGSQQLALCSEQDMQDRLGQLLAGGELVHAEFKIIGIDVTNNTTVTRVRCHLSGNGDKTRLQQNASWSVQWQNSSTETPLIESIVLEEFEEVRVVGTKLFSDRTAAVMQHAPSYQDQLNYPLDYWRDRLDWRFGWLVVGAHGLAVGDANGDGLDDVYVADTGGLPNRLLIQSPDGTVRDTAQEMGVDIIEPTQAALFVDLDNDGDQDLLASVSRFVVVFENDGTGKFESHPVLQTSSMMRSLAAIDYNQDGLLDVFACGYSLRNTGDSVGLGRPLPYHDANNGAPSYLMQNKGGFRFEDVTDAAGLDQNNSRFSYAAAWEDFDNDGDPDLYVANDFGRNNLYRNDGGTFTDVASQAGVEDIAAGMSVSWGDFNRDGLPDIYVGNMFSSAGNRIAYQRQFRNDIDASTLAMYRRHARGNSLFQNMGDGTFRDVSQAATVTEARWAWGSNFADINNDGWQDLLVGNGMVTGTDDSGDL